MLQNLPLLGQGQGFSELGCNPNPRIVHVSDQDCWTAGGGGCGRAGQKKKEKKKEKTGRSGTNINSL